MTRVVVDASVLGWPDSGIRRYVEALVSRLARHPGLDIVLVTNERAEVAAVPHATEVARRVKSGLLWRNTALVLETRRADVLWCPWPTMPVWAVGRPVVVTVHDISPLLHPGSKSVASKVGMAVGGRRAVRVAREVLCVSHTTARDLMRRFNVSPHKITVTPLAVGPQFTPGERSAAQAGVRQRWGVEAPFLLAVGTIEPRKGYELLPPLSRLLPNLPVVVAGRPGPRNQAVLPELKRTCRVLGGVTDDELLDLYRAAEVLLVPSIYEGFGFTPWEAMACGTPAVVAAGSGALEELVGGVMPVVERDPELWAAAVRAAITNREQLKRVGLEVSTRRSWDEVADETAQVLIRAANGPRRSRRGMRT